MCGPVHANMGSTQPNGLRHTPKKTFKSSCLLYHTLQGNIIRLLGTQKEDLAAREAPITTGEFTKKLLSIVPRKPPTILEHEHRTQIDGHEATLAHTAEIIRQELASLGTVASNYVEEARRASITMTAAYDCLQQLLDSNTATTSENKISSCRRFHHSAARFPHSRRATSILNVLEKSD